MWTAPGPWDQKLSYEELRNRNLEVDVASALHVVIGRAPGRRVRDALLTRLKSTTLRAWEMHKSGLELWRLLKFSFDRATAFKVISILESIQQKNPTVWKVEQQCP